MKQRLMWVLGVVFVGVAYSHSANRMDGVANRLLSTDPYMGHECESHAECGDPELYCNEEYKCFPCIACGELSGAFDGECPECGAFCFDTCDVNAACVEGTLLGGECVCNSGYVGDGIACTLGDINECQTGADNCHSSATCTNTDGSFTCACNVGYSGNGVTCTDTYTKYPGYAAYWDSSPGAPFQPRRLYHNDHADLTASLAACEAECQGDTSCYAVEWRADVECRLFDFKPIVYLYTEHWTVSIQTRIFEQLYSDCGDYCGNGAVDGDPGRTFTGENNNYAPIYFKPCSTGSADEGWTCEGGAADESKFTAATGTFTKTSETFSDPGKSFSDPAKPFSDPAKPFSDPDISFGGPAKPFGGPDKPFGDHDKKRVRSTIAGVGLAVVVVLLAIKVVRRRRGFAEVPSVSEV